MSDISYSVTVRHTTFPVEVTSASSRGDITQSGAEASKQIVNVGTSWTAIRQWGFTSESLIAIQNMDATNYVEVALANDGTGIFSRIPASGSPLLIPVLDSATYYIRAHTAACDVVIWGAEA